MGDSRWKSRVVPPICERMLGFSVPQDGVILIISFDEIYLLHLGDEITVELDDEFAGYDVFNHKTGIASYHGQSYRIIGLHGGHPILDSPQGERLILNIRSQRLTVEKDGEVLFSENYKNFSGDWAAATFSPVGRYIVLGCPYDFDFRIYERVI